MGFVRNPTAVYRNRRCASFLGGAEAAPFAASLRWDCGVGSGLAHRAGWMELGGCGSILLRRTCGIGGGAVRSGGWLMPSRITSEGCPAFAAAGFKYSMISAG